MVSCCTDLLKTNLLLFSTKSTFSGLLSDDLTVIGTLPGSEVKVMRLVPAKLSSLPSVAKELFAAPR